MQARGLSTSVVKFTKRVTLMKRKRKKDDSLQKIRSGSTGAPLNALPPIDLSNVSRKNIRGLLKQLVGQHSTEVAMRLREGMLSPNLRLALKYLTLAASYVDGKPVETHRMVGLTEGPEGTYDLTRLTPEDQKTLLSLLRRSKDQTEPKGEVK
jgi:hypothetical protein